MKRHIPSILLFLAFILYASRLFNILDLPLVVAVIHSFRSEKIELSYLLVVIMGASMSLNPAMLVCFILAPYFLEGLLRKVVLPFSPGWVFIEMLLKALSAYMLALIFNFFLTFSFPSLILLYKVILKGAVTTFLLFVLLMVVPHWILDSGNFQRS